MVPHITIQKICKGGAGLYSFAGLYPAAICFLRCFTRMTTFIFSAVRVKILRIFMLFLNQKQKKTMFKNIFKKRVDKPNVFCYNNYVHAGRGVRAV